MNALNTFFATTCLLALSIKPTTALAIVTSTPAAAITALQLRNTSTQPIGAAPVTFGQAFKPGDVPSGRTLAATDGSGTPIDIQVDAKARHADGSLRHAIVSLVAPSLPASGALELALSPATPGAPAAAPAVNIDAAVVVTEAGTRYSASTIGAAGSPSAMNWLSGSIASEWIVTVPLRSAAGVAHPHLEARFGLRAFASSPRARVDVTLENNWAYESAPRNITYDADVLIDGASVYSLRALKHLQQARWRKVFWKGGELPIAVRHDQRYLVDSRAVPSYDLSIAIPESALSDVAAEWSTTDTQPMSAGMIESAMPMAGGRRDIGPLPGWAAQYLISMDPRAKTATLGNGDLAGSFGIHYRDKRTGRPVTLDDFPYMTLLGNPGDTVNPATGKSEAFPDCSGDCASPHNPDSAHQPDLAYLPYLVTGDYFYLEELQFWANWNMLQYNPYYRDFAKGLLKSDQVRGQAWALRTLAEAAYITPDAHPLKAYFVDRVGHNLAHYNATHSSNANANALGFLETSCCTFAYNNGRGLAPWQDDFFTWSVGHAYDLGFADALPLLAWKAKFPVSRMSETAFCWIFASMYSMNVRDTTGGATYTSWSRVYDVNVEAPLRAQTCASAGMAAALTASEGTSYVPGQMIGYASDDAGYPANMQPAIAVSARADVPGGLEAWARFAARASKPSYGNAPSFAIVPRGAGAPAPNLPKRAYLPLSRRGFGGAAKTLNQLRRLFAVNPTLAAIPANTALDLGQYTCQDPVGDTSEYCASITDYSGFVYDPNNHQMLMFGGGHAATFRDDVDVFNFGTLKWGSAYSSTHCADMTLANMNKANSTWKTTGHPYSRHTYDMMVVTTNTNELLLLGGTNGRGNCTPDIDPATGSDPFYVPSYLAGYSPVAKTWRTGLAQVPFDTLGTSEFDPVSGNVVLLSQYGMYVYTPTLNTFAKHLDQFPMDMGYANNMVFFPPNGKFYYLTRGSQAKVFELTLDRTDYDNSSLREVTGISGTAPGTGETGWGYDSVNRIIGGGVTDGVFFAFDPLANAWTRRVMQAQSATGRAVGSVAFHALAYDPVDGVFVFISDAASGRRVWAYRFGGAAPPTATPAPTVPGNRPRAFVPLVRK